MPLLRGIVPKLGDVFMCNFAGYVVPEMVKSRRVVVISPTHQGAPLVLVVPVSLTKPNPVLPIHVRLEGGHKYACFDSAAEVWVKADLIAHVRFDRLDRVNIPGRGFIRTVSLDAADIAAVQRAVLHGLGLGRLSGGV